MKTWFERIVEAHLEVTTNVSHGKKLESERYFVWQEDGSNDLSADGEHAETSMTGTTDLFTKTENDPWVVALGESLDRHGISWYLNSVQYEEETGFFHYEWVWGVA